MAAKSSNSSDNTTRRRRTRRVRVENEGAAEGVGGEGQELDRENLGGENAVSRSEADEPQTAVAEPAAERPTRGPRRRTRVDRDAEPREAERREVEQNGDEPFGHGLSDEPARSDEDSYFAAAERVENRYQEDDRMPQDEGERVPRVSDNHETNNTDGGDGPGPRRRRRRRRRGRQQGDTVQQPQRTERPQHGQHGQRGDRPQHGRPQYQNRDRDRHRGGGRPQGPPQSRQPAVYYGETTGTTEGVLELHPKGYGFLRDPKKNYAGQETDVFVSSTFIEKSGLREGVMIRGELGSGTKGQGPRLKSIETIDGRSIEEYQKIKAFEELTPINPYEQIRLERGPKPVTMRVMDLLTPIAKGQRALIVAPPRTGKTMLLQEIADSVSTNHPEITLMVLLIDERPEEVTELKRRVRGEVIASSMDREVESHVRISQLIMERAKRLAEAGEHVFVLLDSITRTARAFNKWIGNSGKTGTGGLDVRAMDIPRKMFGTARRFDEAGSLTVVATALIDTGSRMDEAIFQEFKGTGNMEMVLSRDLADRRIWPSIDITMSGTRREEKILPPDVLESVTMMRRSLVTLSPVEAMEQLIKLLDRYPSNAEFLAKIRSVL